MTRSRSLAALLLGLLLASASAFAGQEAAPGRIKPITAVGKLKRPKLEKVVRLANARVILADYPLIRHDFGAAIEGYYNKGLHEVSNDEIDGWLLEHSAYVSAAQARQTEVNTQIPTTGTTWKAYRPHDYGRAMVFKAAPGVFIDVKGSGAKAPKQTDHANGLASLGEVIREYAYEQLVNKLFLHSGSGRRTVGHYAVIDAGFDIKFGDGRQDRAGLILRQAHERAVGDVSSLGIASALKIETVLRRYGITSAGAYQYEPFDALNIQGTRDGALLDFGGFLAMPWFSKPAYHFDHTPDIEPRRQPLLAPHAFFVQPDEAHRVPFSLWGFNETGKADPIADNPWIWSHKLATSLANGSASRQDAEQHMRNLMGPVEEQLSH